MYTNYKNRYDKCKDQFNQIKDNSIDDISFRDLGKVSKNLALIKMNFETNETKFKKELWFYKMQKLIKDYYEVKTNFEDPE